MKNGYCMVMKVFIMYITCYTVLYMGLNVAVGSFCQQPPSSDLNLTHTSLSDLVYNFTYCATVGHHKQISQHQHIHNVHKHVQASCVTANTI